MSLIHYLDAIQYAFNIALKLTKKVLKEIAKNYFTFLKPFFFLKNLLYFKIAEFYLNRDFPSHILIVTSKYAY